MEKLVEFDLINNPENEAYYDYFYQKYDEIVATIKTITNAIKHKNFKFYCGGGKYQNEEEVKIYDVVMFETGREELFDKEYILSFEFGLVMETNADDVFIQHVKDGNFIENIF